MKKITLSVAALLIAGVGYSQCNQICVDSINKANYENNVKTFKSIEYQLLDLIDAIRMDMYYGRITQENGAYYIKQVTILRTRNQELVQKMFNEEIKLYN